MATKPYELGNADKRQPAVIQNLKGGKDPFSAKETTFAKASEAQKAGEWRLAVWCEDMSLAKKRAKDLNARACIGERTQPELPKAEKPGAPVQQMVDWKAEPAKAAKAPSGSALRMAGYTGKGPKAGDGQPATKLKADRIRASRLKADQVEYCDSPGCINTSKDMKIYELATENLCEYCLQKENREGRHEVGGAQKLKAGVLQNYAVPRGHDFYCSHCGKDMEPGETVFSYRPYVDKGNDGYPHYCSQECAAANRSKGSDTSLETAEAADPHARGESVGGSKKLKAGRRRLKAESYMTFTDERFPEFEIRNHGGGTFNIYLGDEEVDVFTHYPTEGGGNERHTMESAGQAAQDHFDQMAEGQAAEDEAEFEKRSSLDAAKLKAGPYSDATCAECGKHHSNANITVAGLPGKRFCSDACATAGQKKMGRGGRKRGAAESDRHNMSGSGRLKAGRRPWSVKAAEDSAAAPDLVMQRLQDTHDILSNLVEGGHISNPELHKDAVVALEKNMDTPGLFVRAAKVKADDIGRDDDEQEQSWDTGEVMLWIANDEGLYLAARRCRNAQALEDALQPLMEANENIEVDFNEVDWQAVYDDMDNEDTDAKMSASKKARAGRIFAWRKAHPLKSARLRAFRLQAGKKADALNLHKHLTPYSRMTKDKEEFYMGHPKLSKYIRHDKAWRKADEQKDDHKSDEHFEKATAVSLGIFEDYKKSKKSDVEAASDRPKPDEEDEACSKCAKLGPTYALQFENNPDRANELRCWECLTPKLQERFRQARVKATKVKAEPQWTVITEKETGEEIKRFKDLPEKAKMGLLRMYDRDRFKIDYTSKPKGPKVKALRVSIVPQEDDLVSIIDMDSAGDELASFKTFDEAKSYVREQGWEIVAEPSDVDKHGGEGPNAVTDGDKKQAQDIYDSEHYQSLMVDDLPMDLAKGSNNGGKATDKAIRWVLREAEKKWTINDEVHDLLWDMTHGGFT